MSNPPSEPKRILALDGGGIRGVFTLQILAKIEELFRKEHNKPDLVLADKFDLIAGTSTGAIIAAFLKWGMPVSEIKKLYDDQASKMFARERWYRRWKSKFRAGAIAEFFRETFVENDGTPAKFGSPKLGKYLLVVMRNASTGTSWPLCNNPDAKYMCSSREDCNLDIPIWQLLRASTAAPYYFPPEQIKLGKSEFLFVDGGLTPYNNPSLIAVLTATLPQYKLGWRANREDLHVISVGTGSVRAKLPSKVAGKINMLDQIKYLAPAMLSSVGDDQDKLCRILGDLVNGNEMDSKDGRHILGVKEMDTEIGSLNEPSLFNQAEQKFTYVRYDQPFTVSPDEAKHMVKGQTEMDNVKLKPFLRKTGEDYAEKNVCIEHFYPRATYSPLNSSSVTKL
ncbi:MAG TPA: patatin-like phospholipase family protein [Verrucomicrobiae bacterium]|jgi:patatin-like phospholipase/acyl hydrolase